jgi:hypothetical protein
LLLALAVLVPAVRCHASGTEFTPPTPEELKMTADPAAPGAPAVRLPVVATLTCPPDPAASCTLSGSSLFLIDQVGADAQFSRTMSVPDGFAGSTIEVPHASGNELFVKLRDDPGVVNTLQLPATAVAKNAHPSRPGGRRLDTAAAQPQPAPAATPPPTLPPAADIAPVPQPQPNIPATGPAATPANAAPAPH